MSNEPTNQSILAACQDLHMVSTGSMDGVPTAELVRLETFLQRRLDSWRDYPPIGPFPGVFDGAVRLLIIAALAEWRASPLNPNWGTEAVAR